MNRSMRLEVEAPMRPRHLEAAFGADGLLFLVSSVDGLSLVARPGDGALIHAAFVRRGRRMIGAAVHGSELVGKGGRVGRMAVGDRVSIGLARLKVVAPQKVARWRSVRLFALSAVAAVLAAALLAVATAPGRRARPTAAGVEEAPIAVAARVPEVPPPHAAGLIEEARAHLRAGRTGQARLALMEARESSSDGGEATLLLDEIERGMNSVAGAPSDAGREAEEDEARSFFDEAMKLKASGDLAGALGLIGRAAEKVRHGKVRPTFAASIEEARASLESSAREAAAPRLAAIAALPAEVASLDAAEAIRRLIIAKAEADALAGAGAAAEAAAVEERIEAAIRAAAERWLSGAMSAEGLTGCGRALPMYREIAERLKDVEQATAKAAGEGVIRCGGGNYSGSPLFPLP